MPEKGNNESKHRYPNVRRRSLHYLSIDHSTKGKDKEGMERHEPTRMDVAPYRTRCYQRILFIPPDLRPTIYLPTTEREYEQDGGASGRRLHGTKLWIA